MKPHPTKPTTVSTLCLRAAEVLRERGWCQDGICDQAGKAVCMMGALLVADGHDIGADNPIGKPISDLYVRTTGTIERRVYNIPLWNDKKERTAQQVITLLEEVAWENINK